MKFIVDEMLGKLAKWLRILGYDTLYLRPVADNVLVSQALKERRIILTRDTRLVERKYIPRYVLVKSDRYQEQLKQIIDELNLKPNPGLYFSRCLLCNSRIQPIPKRDVKNRVPEYTYNTHRKFFWCPACQKVYWYGTHIQNVEKRFQEFRTGGSL